MIRHIHHCFNFKFSPSFSFYSSFFLFLLGEKRCKRFKDLMIGQDSNWTRWCALFHFPHPYFTSSQIIHLVGENSFPLSPSLFSVFSLREFPFSECKLFIPIFYFFESIFIVSKTTTFRGKFWKKPSPKNGGSFLFNK